MSNWIRNLPAKGGVVDVVYSPDDGYWYLHRYWLAERRDGTSKRHFDTKEEAMAAYHRGRVQYHNF